jgi:Uma2 family endonuclease
MTATAEVAYATDQEYEVVNGILEAKEMAGARHGGVTARLIGKLVSYVEQTMVGDIYTPDTTFTIGTNERLPDISFVSAERMPEEGEPESIWRIAPDLAVEVISPNDFYEKVKHKLRDYFAAGVREVWLVSPENKEVVIHQSPTQSITLNENDELSSETLLPGFRCKISDLFQPISHRRKAI